MSALLLTKLIPPRPPSTYVVRQRLLDQIDAGTRGRLTLIHAPAGYGKTTLAAAWSAAQQPPDGFEPLWLTLESYDNDPVRFLTYFVGALQRLDPTVGADASQLMQQSVQNEPTVLLNSVINDLVNRPNPVALVLDDWHAISDDTIQRLVQYWIEHVPPHVHTIMTSRDLPDMPLARWRVRGQLTVIGAQALQFTVAEVGRFLRDGIKLSLSDADVQRLTTHTEGWIGALQLLALSLHGRSDMAEQVAQFSRDDHFLMSYLMDEVISRQSAELQTFLTHTAILDHFNADLCNAVTGRHDSQAILRDIERRNLFVSPVDAAGGWYRYHPLLSGYLRDRLAEEQPAEFRQLHARAMHWHLANGSLDEAIEHGLVAGEHDAVARALALRADDLLWRDARAASLNAWAAALPLTTLAAHPTLAVAYCWTFAFLTRFDTLDRTLHTLRPMLAQQDVSAELHAELAGLEAEVALHLGDLDTVIERLSTTDLMALPNRRLQAMMHQVLGYALRLDGKPAAAVDSLRQAQALADRRANLAFWIYSGSDLAEALMIQGDLAGAEAVYRDLISAAPAEQLRAKPFLDTTWIGYASVQLKRNQLDAALDSVQRGLSLSRSAGENRSITRYGLQVLARIRQAQGVWQDVQTLLPQIEEMAGRQATPRVLHEVGLLSAELHLRHGDYDTVAAWIVRQHPERPPTVTRLQFGRAQLVRAGWQLQRDPDAALKTLGALATEAYENGWHELHLACALLQASASQRVGATQKALEYLNTAVALARPGGYVRAFVEQAVDLAPLLRELARARDVDPFIGRIQAAFLPAGAITQPMLDPLTRRETEVLQLMGQGLSNPEIATRLIVATGTVARHTNNIYGKLGVRNRTEAILRARRLGLI